MSKLMLYDKQVGGVITDASKIPCTEVEGASNVNDAIGVLNDAIGVLDAEIGNAYYLIRDRTATPTTATVTIETGRKLSDYKEIDVMVLGGDYIRGCYKVPVSYFTNTKTKILIPFMYSGKLETAEVQYKSDTSLSIYSSVTSNVVITVLGFKY